MPTKFLRALVAVGLLFAGLSSAPAAFAMEGDCEVENVTQAQSYGPDSGQALTDALDDSVDGDEMAVVGTCAGKFSIDVGVKLRGREGEDRPVITTAGGGGEIVHVESEARVILRRVEISGSLAGPGLRVASPVKIVRSIISDNLNPSGPGGIQIEPAATTKIAHSRVVDNESSQSTWAGVGGGIGSRGPLTIKDSTIARNLADNAGGGLSNASGLRIVRSRFVANRATSSGAVSNEGTTVVVDSVFKDNFANYYGSAFSNWAEAEIRRTRVIKNDGLDGTIYNYGTLQLVESMVSRNNGTDDLGGGVSSWAGNVRILRSTLKANRAAFGGAIYNGGEGMRVIDSVIHRNQALGSNGTGGGIFSPSPLRVRRTQVTENSTGGYGGGISVGSDGVLYARKLTLERNLANFGAGLENEGSATIAASSIRFNEARSEGGGIANLGDLTIRTTVISDNVPDDCWGCTP